MQIGQAKGNDTDEEIDYHFSGMMTSHNSKGHSKGWIIDSRASDHMTPDLNHILNPKPLSTTPIINLSIGDTTTISHSGTMVILSFDLVLHNVLCVPTFKHNVLSFQRLVKDAPLWIVQLNN